jgi:hypothetical protein
MKTLKVFEDFRGCLIPIEFNDLPFVPKRVFFINDVPVNCIRGNHSHYETKQFLICVGGIVEVIIHDGFKEKSYFLKKGETILIPELIWGAQKFILEKSEILVLCSTNYEENDYILDFETFKKIKNGCE